MTFEQLNYFVEVYRHKSITKAADSLYVSRQAVSLTIKKLEQEFEVSLFNRVTNGIIPTHAADILYSSAIKILKEQASLKQKLFFEINHKKIMPVCKIGIGLAFVSICGEKILEELSLAFPNTYFILESFTRSENKDFYKNFDICIITIQNELSEQLSNTIDQNYAIKTITEYPIYTWISSKSPLNQKEVIDLVDLKSYTFATLRNYYNEMDLLKAVELQKIQIIDTKKNFADYIEKFNYFALDLPINYGQLLYRDMFAKNKINKKITSSSLLAKIIYNKEHCEEFSSVLVSIFPQ